MFRLIEMWEEGVGAKKSLAFIRIPSEMRIDLVGKINETEKGKLRAASQPEISPDDKVKPPRSILLFRNEEKLDVKFTKKDNREIEFIKTKKKLNKDSIEIQTTVEKFSAKTFGLIKFSSI